MSENIKLLRNGANVTPIYWALMENPQFWNEHNDRTRDPNSPHYGLDDIWVRYGKGQNALEGKEHSSLWYPCADVLPVKSLCLDIMRMYNGVELGGVLITRIPPGAICKPHTDPGWHARTYDKFAVQIMSAPGQYFCFEDGNLETRIGDVFWFNNQKTHWVTNDTKYERITMIVCIRLEKGE